MSNEQRGIIEITQKLAIVLVQVTEYEAMPMNTTQEIEEKETASYRLRDSIGNLRNELGRISDNFNKKGEHLAHRAEEKTNVG